jgi:hypothetical protein
MRSLTGREFMPNRTQSGGLYSVGKRFGECFCEPVMFVGSVGAAWLFGVHELEQTLWD